MRRSVEYDVWSTWQFRPNVVPDNFFNQMSYSAKCRIDQKLYATICRIGEMVLDELSCTREFEPMNNFKVQVKFENKYCKERQPG